MSVPKLFYELSMIPNVEIVVRLLPEVGGLASQSSQHTLFQRLERVSERSSSRFTDQQMDVFRHNNIAVDAQPETPPDLLKRNFKRMLCRRIDDESSRRLQTEFAQTPA